MRRLKIAAHASCVPALALALTLGALPSSSQAADKYAAEFLNIGVGARALGMGGAFVSLASDASASYWNPAGIAGLERAELLVMHSEHFGDLVNHDYFSFVQPLSGDANASVGISLIRVGIDDITVTRDAFDDQNGDGEWQEGEEIFFDRFQMDSDVEYGLLLSYAREYTDRLFLGGNVKLLRQGLIDNTSFGMGLDIGAMYFPSPNLTLGARLADATTTQISWDTGHHETVAPSLTVGARYTVLMPAAFDGSVTVAADLREAFDGSDEVSQLGGGLDSRLGLEYWFKQLLAARVGSDTGNFTAGAGLNVPGMLQGMSVDYAFLAHDELDDTHRLSASVRF